MSVARTFAVGDPQAPFATFLAILRHHQLLDGRGQLRDDVKLISMGDHFDWGKPVDRERATQDALDLVRWLAGHDREQVTMIVGNHDTARLGEMWGVDDDTFLRARSLADRAYYEQDSGAREQFRRAHPGFATDEIVARDFSAWRKEQNDVVAELFRARRFKLAHAQSGKLFVHAGVTDEQLALAGAPSGESDVDALADTLNRALHASVDAWSAANAANTSPGAQPVPLELRGPRGDALHLPGNAQREGMGMLYHRPSRGLDEVEKRELEREPPRRRFDPSRLPRGVTQVIGHIRDSKCRKLMADVCDAQEAQDGPIRSLVVDDAGLRYRHGIQRVEPGARARTARVIFLDNGMSALGAAPERYEILDVDAEAPAR